MKLGDKIWVCRKKAGLSQEALAEKIGVSRQAISKWETNEAAPEITKLPLLARTFGVTADWLLDDEAGFDEEAPEEEPMSEEPVGASSARPPEPTYPEWIDHLPGFLGRMIRKYGWLYGVRMAITGALFSGMGLLGKAIFRSMSNSFSTELPGFSTGVTFYDEAGNIVDPSHFGLTGSDLQSMGLGGFAGPSVSFQTTAMSDPANMMCNFIIGIGLIMLISGAMLAWYLKKKGQQTL